MTSRHIDAGRRLLILAALAIVALVNPASGQETATAGDEATASADSLRRLMAFRPAYVNDPVRIMIVGTFHFANPGRDLINPDAGDMLSPRRQAEIERLVSDLAGFAPTKIAIEAPMEQDSTVQAHYNAVRAGRASLRRNESDQIGLRLAARLGHERVYPVDHRRELAMHETLKWAEEHEPGTAASAGRALQSIGPVLQRLIAEHTIPEIVLAMNSEMSDVSHGLYLDMALIGAGEENGWVGADVAMDWYERNLRIFANIARIAEPGDRILVVYGAGHEFLLRHFAELTPGFEAVRVAEFVRP